MKWISNFTEWPIWSWYTKWEWMIVVIGVLTIFYVFINIFTALGDHVPNPYIENSVTLSDLPKFEKVLATSINSTVEKGSPITILTNGQEFLPDLLSEIKNAKQSIYITDYIWDDGKFGSTLFTALIEKSKEGVEVKILLDGMSGRKANPELIKELEKSGGKVERFRPVKWSNITRIDRRTHVRDFVIDNKIAYMGGIAISDLWLGNATSSSSWHDFMFKTHGKMAERSNHVFANMWSQTTGEIISATSTLNEAIDSSAQSQNSSSFVSLFSTPAPDMSSNMEHFIWLSIMSAQKTIRIENPYLIPNKSIVEALKKKAEEGVDVQIIAPGKNTDTKYTRWASQSFYTSLLESGVKVFEYQPSRIHAKIMIMDGKWSIIGSANLDNRSSQINLEYIIGVNDPSFAKDLNQKFEEDKTKSKEITKEDWKQNHNLMIPVRFLSTLFIHQY